MTASSQSENLPVYWQGAGAVKSDVAAQTAVVLVHGFPLDHRMWQPVASLLADRLAAEGRVAEDGAPIAVMSVDLPGLGVAGVPDGEPSLTVSARLLAQTLTASGIRHAVVAGMSMGGYVALELMRLCPEVIQGLALVDSKDVRDTDAARANRLRSADEVAAAGTTAPVLGMAETQLGASSLAEVARVTQVRTWISEQSAQAVAWSQRAMAARDDYRGVLPDVTVPVAILVGADDRLTTPELAREVATRASNVEVTVIADGGHLAAWENPEATAAGLYRLLARCGMLREDAR